MDDILIWKKSFFAAFVGSFGFHFWVTLQLWVQMTQKWPELWVIFSFLRKRLRWPRNVAYVGPILDTFEHFKDTGMHLRVDRFAVLGPLEKHSQLPLFLWRYRDVSSVKIANHSHFQVQYSAESSLSITFYLFQLSQLVKNGSISRRGCFFLLQNPIGINFSLFFTL